MKIKISKKREKRPKKMKRGQELTHILFGEEGHLSLDRLVKAKEK